MSFISDYLLATSKNESPTVYHQWSCLSVLSCLAGRRFWIKLGPFVYYPNFYTILVGDPGVKKNTALDPAKEIIRSVGGIPIAATSTTKEAIVKEMGNDKYRGKRFFKNEQTGLMEEYNQLCIMAGEFTTFLGVNPIGMVDFLTNIYSEKVYDEKYKHTGEFAFTGPYITMLACMTPEIVKGYLKLNILTGGFGRRTMFVWGNRGQPVAIPGYTQEMVDAYERCIEWGKKIQVESGEITLSPEAWEWYTDWYHKNYAELKDRKPAVQGYFGTKHEFLFKTGILFCLSETDSRVLRPEDLDALDRMFFLPAEKHLDRVFEGAGINPNAAAASQICRMLEALDRPMSKKKVEAMFFDSATSLNELRDTIIHLCNVGRLAVRNVIAGGQLVGEVIGTPQVLQRYSDVQLLPFLRPDAVPPSEEGMGLSS
jgi:hypothetical protein